MQREGCAQPVSVKCVGGIDINELNNFPNLIGIIWKKVPKNKQKMASKK